MNRLSGLLNRIRNHGSKSCNKKHKIVKEHRIQVRWSDYDESKKEFSTVRQREPFGLLDVGRGYLLLYLFVVTLAFLAAAGFLTSFFVLGFFAATFGFVLTL